MADTGDLGQYKVIVAADYSNLTKGISDVLKSIQSSADGVSSIFAKMTDNIEKASISGNKINDTASAMDSFKQSSDSAHQSLQKLTQETNGMNSNGIKAVDNSLKDAARSASTYESVLSKVRSHMLWMASAGITGAVFAAPFEAIHTIADVEKQMAGMIQVLPQLHGNQQALNTVSQQFITIAEQYGMQVDKIIEAGKLWGRGYKDVGEIMQLTGLSAKLATADMMDVTLANRAVESTINSFGRQADAVSYASHVVDSWTNIAHNAQSSATDLAEALMRSGAAAHAVGVSLDTTNALASTMIKTTGLEGANVGNALKSIFSSIHSDKAVADLKNLGIEVSSFDKNGTQHFRDVSSVITDLMLKTHETSTNMAKDLQDISGGKFQWSKAAALFGDYADFIKAYNLSISSTGFSEGQVGAQMDTISRKAEQVKASLTGVLNGMGNSGLSAQIKSMLDSVNDFIKGLQQIPASTYQAVGSLTKLGAEAYVGYKSLAFLAAGMTGMRNAFISIQAAKAEDTAATFINTAATGSNSTSKVTSAASSRANAVAIGTEVAAKEVDTAVTAEATVATGAWATATTVATGGLNLLIAGLIGGALYSANYTTSLGEEANALDKLSQKNQDAVAIKEQEVEMSQKQTEFIGTLGEAYIKLTQQLKDVQGNEEKVNKTKKDLQATENELAKVVGEDGLQRIKSSSDVKQAIKDEQASHTDMTASIKDELATLKKQQIEYTQQALQSTVDRIDALKSETKSWGLLARAQQAAMNMYAGIADAKIAWNTALSNTLPNGSVGQANAQKDLAYWQNEKQYASNYKPSSVTEEISALEQKQNELQIKLGQQQISAAAGYVVPQTTSTGGDEVDTSGGKKKKGKKEVDNSPERISYDYFISQGFSKEVAAGIVGNLMTESGLNPKAESNDGSYGIGQWLGGRRQGLQDFASSNYSDPSSMDTQLAFVNYELKHSESGALGSILASNPTTPEAAAYSVSKNYERPEWAENPDRQENARTVYDKYANGNGGKYEALDPAKQREKFYADMKKSYEEELQAEKTAALEQGRFWKSNDTLYLFQTMLGQVGKDIPAYESERFKLQQDKQKEDQELQSASYARTEALTEAGIDNVHKIEASITASVANKQPIGKYQESIYESMLKSASLPAGSAAKDEEDKKRYNEIAARDKATYKDEQEIIQKHINALKTMADKEIEYQEKLHLISPQQASSARNIVNETDYQKKLPELQSGLTKTANTGSESAMLDAYTKFQNSKTAEESKGNIETMLSLSKDTDATLKAVSKMEESWDKYEQNKRQYSQETYDYLNRYQEAYINAYQNAWGDALDATLNKTRSFSDNAKNIFKSLYSALAKQLSTDFTQKWTQSLSDILNKTKSTNQEKQSDSQSTSTKLKQDVSQILTSTLSADTQKQASSKVTAAAQQQDSSKTKTSVLGDIGSMLTSMLAEMAIMYALSALFGGGGSSTSTSTSSVSLGRSASSYYTTPTAVPQITVPSMDIGGQLPSDMLILAHKREMVLTPQQSDAISNLGSNSNSQSNSQPSSPNAMTLRQSLSVNAIDTRGMKEAYMSSSGELANTVKREIRRFNTTGLT